MDPLTQVSPAGSAGRAVMPHGSKSSANKDEASFSALTRRTEEWAARQRRPYQIGRSGRAVRGPNPVTRVERGTKDASGRLPLLRQPPAKHVRQRLDRQFDEHERLGDQVRAAAQARFRAALEISEARHEDHRRRPVQRRRANARAQFESVHPRHLHIEKE